MFFFLLSLRFLIHKEGQTTIWVKFLSLFEIGWGPEEEKSELTLRLVFSAMVTSAFVQTGRITLCLDGYIRVEPHIKEESGTTATPA